MGSERRYVVKDTGEADPELQYLNASGQAPSWTSRGDRTRFTKQEAKKALSFIDWPINWPGTRVIRLRQRRTQPVESTSCTKVTIIDDGELYDDGIDDLGSGKGPREKLVDIVDLSPATQAARGRFEITVTFTPASEAKP
jgi:hypothetical protein